MATTSSYIEAIKYYCLNMQATALFFKLAYCTLKTAFVSLHMTAMMTNDCHTNIHTHMQKCTNVHTFISISNILQYPHMYLKAEGNNADCIFRKTNRYWPCMENALFFFYSNICSMVLFELLNFSVDKTWQ